MHAHHHDHDHHGHDHHAHGVSADADRRYLTLALLLLTGYMALEVVAGIIASSLALISDAGHMLTDVAAIGLALVAMHLARRPADGHYTFGFKRAEILSAQANGITLLLLSGWFIIEAVFRLVDPPQVEGRWVFFVALAGIVVNLLAVWIMSKANRRSLNVEGSFQHILTDLYAFIATAVAGAVIWATGWNRVDALAALVVAGLMLRAGYGLVRDSGRVFLEAAPRDLHPAAISEAILAMPHVNRLDDLHVWEVTSEMPALSAHVLVSHEVDCHDTRRDIEHMLKQRFGITHTTLQTDHCAEGEPTEAAPCAFGRGHLHEHA
ncbi:cation diffusion facilitator family transporter [Oleiagrimonas sp. MCCC 1A03011]|uniref:cation diffusion facilitator family transporter n=1 Tax=Oleiagrimonas sp. MCCC 1A03011 TaxID=1926883 RepID=UPI000DC21AC4|nr:cation diffusion facilitator family transporter [Oleiagrimonas sp. MCCC 1A03011]RAP57350.1 cation transporter [Oleiagrimonas sp. MCCC 1A03011]